jgi:hypothetical protein
VAGGCGSGPVLNNFLSLEFHYRTAAPHNPHASVHMLGTRILKNVHGHNCINEQRRYTCYLRVLEPPPKDKSESSARTNADRSIDQV